MKSGRVLLAILAAALALAAAAAGLALTPAFQTWAARRFLASRPRLGTSVGSVSLGLAEADFSNLRVERGGAALAVPSLRVELPLAADAWGGRMTIRRLSAAGWTLDLSRRAAWSGPVAGGAGIGPRGQATDSAASRTIRGLTPSLIPSARADDAAASAAVFRVFEGFFQQLRLPADLQLDALDLDGDVLLPPAGGRPGARVHVTMSGGGLAAGREGSFIFSLRFARPRAGRPSARWRPTARSRPPWTRRAPSPGWRRRSTPPPPAAACPRG